MNYSCLTLLFCLTISSVLGQIRIETPDAARPEFRVATRKAALFRDVMMQQYNRDLNDRQMAFIDYLVDLLNPELFLAENRKESQVAALAAYIRGMQLFDQEELNEIMPGLGCPANSDYVIAGGDCRCGDYVGQGCKGEGGYPYICQCTTACNDVDCGLFDLFLCDGMCAHLGSPLPKCNADR
jgi:hypothetical protein